MSFINNTIQQFLHHRKDLAIGFREINFSKPSEVDTAQIGYSIDPTGKNLADGSPGHWQKEWIVIAWDELGDPIMIDTSNPILPVLSAIHGMGNWEPYVIAESLMTFEKIIDVLYKASKGRTDPVKLAKKPFLEKERNSFLKEIIGINTDVDIDFWRIFLENDED